MSTTEKTISALLQNQLPDFIKADHPKFKRFLELYYQWMENNSPTGISNTAGNTIYHAMNLDGYRDIDSTPDEFMTYFKNEILPYFPESSSLDLRKILKSAREFYSKKGSEESIRWLFRALFNEDIEVNYPKEQILIASDGKWKLPRAFRITVTENNKNIDVSLLRRCLVTGEESGATCVIESANRTIDTDTGKEIIEIYISNIKKYFNNGEYINVYFIDSDGVRKLFRERIIGTISNIRIDSNIRTDPSQKRRGLLYNVGDPIVFIGGLAPTAEAQEATGIVGNVTLGSIEAVNITFPGYGYRIHPNTEVIVLRSVLDDPNANSTTDLRVYNVNVAACTTNSQLNFLEPITYDKSVIDYVSNTVIGNANLAFFTVTNRNIVLNLTEADSLDPYNNYEQIWANGNNYSDALFTAKIASPNSSGFCQGGANYTGDLLLYDVANTGTLSVILNGAQINTKNTTKSFTFNSITTYPVPANANSQLLQCFNFVTENTGGIDLISVLDGGYGFRTEPTLQIDSHYDTFLSDQYDLVSEETQKRAHWQTFKDLGFIAHVYINNGGSGYANNETFTFEGRGYGGSGRVTVGANGRITSITIDNRGEGYLTRPSVNIATTSGTGAVLTPYLFGEGVTQTIETSAIGRIRDLRLVYRGYDYVSTPNVSLKVMDVVINPVAVGERFFEAEYIYQGNNISTSSFRANVDFYDSTSGVLRLYNFSGEFDTTVDLLTQNNVICNVNTSMNVPAPAQYPAYAKATGLPNPMYYGNGKARAFALFANGLIEFNGFFLNSDGFPSSDKRLQDGKVYHNYSYIISSEKNLVDFENPVRNIVHPAGMSLISKTISKRDQNTSPASNSSVGLVKQIPVGATVTVANSFANTVTGNGTQFLVNEHRANAGDMIIITDETYALRTQTKTIANVSSNTDLTVVGDFIYVGQGKLTTNNGNINASISGNSNAVGLFLIAGDQIRFGVRNLTIPGTVDVTGNVIESNTTTYFVGNVVVGSEITVNNEVRTVITVTNNAHLIVNTAFNNNATNKYLTTNSVMLRTVSSLSGNTIVMNSAVHATRTNLVYQVVPDYSSANYSYEIITLTSYPEA